ncbi:uncharacterized protein [Aegilops tauschii subsp. strangulata]|uniref:uncharacterized protein n=1 Tax=Aegilops tauschii subsp. strangulata TaxID=200361 RepID=UPI003CC83E79
MAEEPSAKRHCGETSDQSGNLDDVHVPGQKLEYTQTLEGVELHDKETLEVVCTSEPDKAGEMIFRIRRSACSSYPRIIDVDVEFTKEDEPPQMAAVLQLSVEDLCLVYHIATTTKWPTRLKELLQEEKLFTIVGFGIQDDKDKLKVFGLEISPNKHIDIQHNWRVPYTGKEYDSLADLAASVIHPFYKNMKKKIDKKEDHKLWGVSPLPDYPIKYATIDAYATYKSWKKIDNIKTGLEISKEQEEDPFFHCHYAG